MSENKLPKIIVIVGATASGKTALSLEVAKRFNGEIISADSRQIYREMSIGTAKPAPQKHRRVRKHGKNKELVNGNEMFYSNGIRHHLIDMKNPDQDYSVGQYKKDALAAIRKILKASKLPIIVGGTGLYVDAVVKNFDMPKVKENKKLRAKLKREIKTKGLDFVFKKLVELDPEAAYIVDPKNPRRIIRAMEVALSTGRPFSAQRKIGLPLFDFLQIGLKLSPEKLKEKIQKRTKEMIKNGLVNEVGGLVKKYGYTLKAFDAIGYREIIDYLKTTETQKGQENRNLGQGISLKEAETLINKNTWHYARRQMTWFKRNPAIHWFNAGQRLIKKEIKKLASNFLQA